MTIFEFLDELKNSPDQHWNLLYRDMLRNNGQDPIAFLATKKTGKHYSSSEVRQAAERLGLTRKDQDKLIRASDKQMKEQDEWILREELCKACGFILNKGETPWVSVS